MIEKEKKTSIVAATLKKTPNEYPKKVHTFSNLSNVKTLVTRENTLTQESIAKSLNTSIEKNIYNFKKAKLS